MVNTALHSSTLYTFLGVESVRVVVGREVESRHHIPLMCHNVMVEEVEFEIYMTKWCSWLFADNLISTVYTHVASFIEWNWLCFLERGGGVVAKIIADGETVFI